MPYIEDININMITNLALGLLERLINRALQLNKETLQQLNQQHLNKSLALNINGAPGPIYVTVAAEGLHLSVDAPSNIDASIEGSLWSLFQLQRSKHSATASNDKVILTGDMNFAQDLKHILSQINIDWEEQLSHWIGGSMAHQVVTTAVDVKEKMQESAADFADDVSHYIQHEQPMVPTQEALTEFVAAIDELRDEVARLAVRIEKVKQHA